MNTTNFKRLPILLNAGTSSGRPKKGNLYARELYLSPDGHLYYGDPSSSHSDETRPAFSVVSGRLDVKSKTTNYPIEIGYQRKGKGVNNSSWTSDTDGEDERDVVFRFGKFRYIFGDNTLYCDRDSTGRRAGSESDRGKIKGLASVTTDEVECGKVILTIGTSYGNSLPTTGMVNGQLFFKTLN